jgi:hypothetical protein
MFSGMHMQQYTYNTSQTHMVVTMGNAGASLVQNFASLVIFKFPKHLLRRMKMTLTNSISGANVHHPSIYHHAIFHHSPLVLCSSMALCYRPRLGVSESNRL